MGSFNGLLYNGFKFFMIVSAAYFFCKIIECFVDIKKGWKIPVLISFSLVVQVIIYINDSVNVSYTLIWFCVVMLAAYKGSIIKRISVVMVLYPVVVSVNFLFMNLAYSIGLGFLTWSFMVSVFWMTIYIFMKDRIIYAKQYISDKLWILLDVICITPLFVIIGTIIWTEDSAINRALAIAAISIISNLGILFLIEYLIRSVKMRMDNYNYRMKEGFYRELDREQLRIRQLNHDMNNNLNIVASYLEEDQKDKALDFLGDLSKRNNGRATKRFCKDSILNAVLNNKYSHITENEIDFKANLSLGEEIGIDSIDLCSIFSNTIDNAIEASMKIEEERRKIEIKGRIVNGRFMYSVKNNKGNNIIKDGENIRTDKTDKKSHGYGLKNIREIVDKYSGNMEISHDENHFEIVLSIPL